MNIENETFIPGVYLDLDVLRHNVSMYIDEALTNPTPAVTPKPRIKMTAVVRDAMNRPGVKLPDAAALRALALGRNQKALQREREMRQQLMIAQARERERMRQAALQKRRENHQREVQRTRDGYGYGALAARLDSDAFAQLKQLQAAIKV